MSGDLRVADGLAWREAGPADGPAVVLLHGFPASSLLWRDLVPALAPPMRVVAPDLFGGGASAEPDDPSVEGAVAAVRGLLARLGVGAFAAVGHGHGGAVARAIADAFRAGLGHPERLPVPVLEAYAEPWVADAGRYRRAAAALARPVAVGDAPDVPTFLLWGEDDRVVPVEEAERQADAIPTSTLAVLPGCGHFLPDDAAETVVPIVREFLRGRYLGLAHEHAPGPVEVFLGRRPPLEAERIDT